MSDHELREPARAGAWLAAGLCLARLPAADADATSRVATWLLGVLAERGALPPAGVVADLGQVLRGHTARALPSLPALPGDLAGAVHAYDEHVLGRLEADPRLDAVIDAVARLPGPDADRAIGIMIARLLDRVGLVAGVSVNPGALRRLGRAPADELAAQGFAALAQGGDTAALLAAGYRGLTSGARRLGALIGEPELFLAENIDALGELTQRVAIAQIVDVAAALSAALPRRMKAAARRERDRIPTPLAAEDPYPTGGFASLSTAGSLENLVASELAYMDDDLHVDLFDIRHAEGELLYYIRDESVLSRGRRVITFALLPDLESLRVKDPDLPWQRLILALGLVTTCVRRLVEWLAADGLALRLVTVRGAEHEPLAAERALLALVLRDLVARQVVELGSAATVGEIARQAAAYTHGARSDLIVVSGELVTISPSPGVMTGALRLGDVQPRLHWAHRPPQPATGEPDPWRAWIDVAHALLHELL